MLIRLVVSCALACGLLASGATAFADSAAARTFKGKTSQGYRIKFAVKEQSFKIKVFEADLKCSDGSELILIEGGFLWTKIGKGGRFHDAQFGKTDSVYFRGRATDRRIRGRVRLTDKLKGGVKCHSRWIRFNATPRR